MINVARVLYLPLKAYQAPAVSELCVRARDELDLSAAGLRIQ